MPSRNRGLRGEQVVRACLACDSGRGLSGKPTSSVHIAQCINPMTDLESCGGCVGGKNDKGVDCSSLPNVEKISCIAGMCLIGEAKYFLASIRCS